MYKSIKSTREKFLNSFNEQVEKYNAHKNKPTINKKLPKCVICDLDGTLTYIGGREPFDFSKVSLDEPNKNVIDLIKQFHQQGIKVVFLSGRSEICAEDTVDWIRKYCSEYPEPKFVKYDSEDLKDIINDPDYSPVLLRRSKDMRKGHIAKREIFEKAILPYLNPILALDDTKQIVDLWKYLDIPVWQIVGDTWKK